MFLVKEERENSKSRKDKEKKKNPNKGWKIKVFQQKPESQKV